VSIHQGEASGAGESVGGNRFEGYDLATKYGWMQTGEGPAAVEHGVRWLHGLGEVYTESQADLNATMARLKVTWHGTSADAAAGAMTELAGWVAEASQVASAGGGSMDSYGSSFAEMKPRIPNPADAGPQSTGGAVLDAAMGAAGPLTGLESAYAKRMAALDQQANAALYAHQRVTQSALASFPLSEPPPAVTAGGGSASATVPAGHAGVGGVGPASGSGPGAAGAGTRPSPPGGTGAAGAGAAGAGAGGAGAGGAAAGGDRSGAAAAAGAGTGAPVGTHSAGWTPLAPVNPAGGAPPPGGVTPGPPAQGAGGFAPSGSAPTMPGLNGGGVPPSSGVGPGSPLPGSSLPGSPLPGRTPFGAGGPAGGGAGGPAGGGGVGPGPGERPLASRGGAFPGGYGEPGFGSASPGAGTAAAPGGPGGARGAGAVGMGGVPLGAGAAAAARRGDKEHRTKLFIPSDEPFVVPVDEDVTPGVIGAKPRDDEDDWS
jgi:hypothetical protein